MRDKAISQTLDIYFFFLKKATFVLWRKWRHRVSWIKKWWCLVPVAFVHPTLYRDFKLHRQIGAVVKYSFFFFHFKRLASPQHYHKWQHLHWWRVLLAFTKLYHIYFHSWVSLLAKRSLSSSSTMKLRCASAASWCLLLRTVHLTKTRMTGLTTAE